MIKVISGFQTGADIAGIKAAKDLGLETGGYMPKGFITEKGNKPIYKDLYNAQETNSTGYLGRTLKNVLSSDGTIIFDYAGSSGSKNTKTYCSKNNKPFLYLSKTHITSNQVVEDIVKFIETLGTPCVINIAGNRESVHKGLEKMVYDIIIKAFKIIKEKENETSESTESTGSDL